VNGCVGWLLPLLPAGLLVLGFVAVSAPYAGLKLRVPWRAETRITSSRAGSIRTRACPPRRGGPTVSTEPQPATEVPPATADPQLGAPSGPGPQQPSPQQPSPQQPGPLPHHTIRHTRISGLWFAVVFFAVVLLFLLVFILQNGREVDIAYLGAHGHLPLGVALLLAAVCGVLLTILAGVARMGQLRAVARKHRRADADRR
jgi:lipopolysaccharide assembly protein A